MKKWLFKRWYLLRAVLLGMVCAAMVGIVTALNFNLTAFAGVSFASISFGSMLMSYEAIAVLPAKTAEDKLLGKLRLYIGIVILIGGMLMFVIGGVLKLLVPVSQGLGGDKFSFFWWIMLFVIAVPNIGAVSAYPWLQPPTKNVEA